MSVAQAPPRNERILQIYFTLATLEGLGALVGLLTLPRDPKNAWLLGFSRTRLLMLVVVLLGSALFGVATWLLWRETKWGERIGEGMYKVITRNWVYIPLLLLSALVFVVGVYAYVLSIKFTDAQVLALLARLLPVVLWLAALGLQTLVVLPLLRFGPKAYKVERQPLLAAGIAFGVLVVLGIVMSLTGLGLQPDRTGWDNIGVPLLPTQTLAAWGVGVGVLLMGWLLQLICGRFPRFGEVLARFRLFDWLLVVGLWLWAMFAWWGEPLTPTYFSPRPRAPNYEYYPFSDAALLDVNAESILIGEGYARIAEKPLYNLFLAGLHALVGHDYLDVVYAQIVVLALFPALVYLLGSAAHHRLGGAIAAVLLIFRERNAIALSGEIGVSHSKLMMTDFPAALGLALLTLVCFLWLRKWEQRRALPLVAGGLLGLFLLLRSQAILLVPVFLVGIAVIQYRKPNRLLESAGLLVLGVALAILPWMIRNYQKTGNFGYSQPLQAGYIARQYSFTPELEDRDPDVGSSAASQGLGSAREFAFANPGYVSRFIFSHTLHNEVSSLLALPARFTLADNLVTFYNLHPYWESDQGLWQDCCSLHAYVDNLPFWPVWDGSPRDFSLLPLCFTLGMVALGIGAAWKQNGLVGLLPLVIHLTYSLTTAVARVSGWRLILPVDWVVIFYFGLGLSQLTLIVLAAFTNSKVIGELCFGGNAVEAEPGETKFPWRAVLGIGLAILLIALSVPLVEVVIPQRYHPYDKQAALVLLKGTDYQVLDEVDQEEFLTAEYMVALWGRALYPRFYEAGEGEPSEKWSAFEPRPYSRLGFYLVGPKNAQVVVPMPASPERFPHAVDVLVYGCEDGGSVYSFAVILLDESGNAVVVGEQEQFTCPVGK